MKKEDVRVRNCLMGLWFLIAALVLSPGIQAQTASQDRPDLSGIWGGIGGVPRRAETSLCGIGTLCTAVTGVRPEPNPNTIEEPEMLPWAEEYVKRLRGNSPPGTYFGFPPGPPEYLNPSWGGCMPDGPTESMRRWGFELRQFPDMVLLLFSRDSSNMRRIYVDGRGHAPDLKPTWNGHSIGRYEGDTLVVDTVGISNKAWVDLLGHPHTDALRVTERIRRIQPERLQIEATIDDPKTYRKPWKMTLFKQLRAERGPQIDLQVRDGVECEELLQMGTHFSAESKSEREQ